MASMEMPVLKPAVQGNCMGCGRGIPFGYIPTVTKWEKREWGKGMKVSVPVEIWCQDCKHLVSGVSKPRRWVENDATPVAEADKLSLKEVAVKVFAVLSREVAYGSKKIAKLADLTEDYVPEIKTVLKKLKDAGKVRFEEGRWLRA